MSKKKSTSGLTMSSNDIATILRACKESDVAGIKIDGLLEANFYIMGTENQTFTPSVENIVEMQNDIDDNKNDSTDEQLPELGDLALDDPVRFENLVQGQSEYGE